MEQHDAHYPVCTDNYCDDNFPFGHLLFLDQLHDISNKPNLISGQKWLHGGALLSHSAEYSRVFGDGNTYRCLNFTHWCSRRSEFGCANKTSKYYCKQVNDENNVMAKGITLSRLKLDMKKLTQDWTGPMCRNVCFKSDGIVELCDFYECRKGQDHEWIPCMHEGRYPCERYPLKDESINVATQMTMGRGATVPVQDPLAHGPNGPLPVEPQRESG
ncbi:hypothetical protein TTRE_0000713901 [Trichuris trichiura]|uniref:Uncharacterized protein n=1 Tax=Trichuris trichiura TaxID=36087 RepID=A0A077ZG78_TRITR|nr:hypothetical protein TTRE_0000713901 [Trichuris trichiura]